MTEDPRMRLKVSTRPIERHSYIVKVDGADGLVTEDRHLALQFYNTKRRELSDFATEPENYRVRIWCDGAEFFCDQEQWPQGYRDRGKSCRQITGAVRPFPWERHMP